MSAFAGRHTHALFLDIIRAVSPALAEKLHADTAIRPFTVSPLLGVELAGGVKIQVRAGQRFLIRFTFLDDTIRAVFTDAMQKQRGKNIMLDNVMFVLDSVKTSHGNLSLCSSHDPVDLLNISMPVRKISIRFFTPTAFRSQGKRNVIFPLPVLVFGSWYARWQNYAGTAVTDLSPAVFEEIRVSRYALLTRAVRFVSYQEIGFEGDCVFELPRQISDEDARCLNALADFAFYCGTGAKTTMGMGQTRRI